MKIVFLLLFTITLTSAQIETTWETLNNSPSNTRKNDIHLIDKNTIWIVSGLGEAHFSSDGGNTWILMHKSDSTFFRSVAFLNNSIGFIGNLGPDEYGGPSITDKNLIYRTTDGGFSWNPIKNISGETGKGICGMQTLGDKYVYAVGRVRGPSFFMKSTDAGENWISKDLGSLADGLIDVHFFNPDTGIIVGLTNSNHSLSKGIILQTNDGGESWSEVYQSSRIGEWFWKISFPSRNVGYISLQRNVGSPVNFVKTTDGGKTWFEKQFSSDPYFVQGIGFANDTLGWIGGNSTQTTYQTTNGGDTWFPADFGSRINRFRFLNEVIGFAAGQSIYKYSGKVVSSIDYENIVNNFSLSQNFPNPFNPYTKIRFTIPELTPIDGKSSNGLLYTTIKIYDSLGKLVQVLIDEELRPGENEIEFYPNNLSSGVYYYQLQSGNYTATKKMIYLK